MKILRAGNYRDIEFDSKTSDFFYMGTLGYYYEAYFILRVDNLGGVIWKKTYSTSTNYIYCTNTLQYSPTYRILYHLLSTSPVALVKVNSSNGEIIESYQITGYSAYSMEKSICRISNDELSYF